MAGVNVLLGQIIEDLGDGNEEYSNIITPYMTLH